MFHPFTAPPPDHCRRYKRPVLPLDPPPLATVLVVGTESEAEEEADAEGIEWGWPKRGARAVHGSKLEMAPLIAGNGSSTGLSIYGGGMHCCNKFY